ncbi:hypothetical protein ACPV5U_19310 [Vibrio mediterranei]
MTSNRTTELKNDSGCTLNRIEVFDIWNRVINVYFEVTDANGNTIECTSEAEAESVYAGRQREAKKKQEAQREAEKTTTPSGGMSM